MNSRLGPPPILHYKVMLPLSIHFKCFLLRWNETQIPKSTQMTRSYDYPLEDKATLAEDKAGPYASGIIWGQAVPRL